MNYFGGCKFNLVRYRLFEMTVNFVFKIKTKKNCWCLDDGGAKNFDIQYTFSF